MQLSSNCVTSNNVRDCTLVFFSELDLQLDPLKVKELIDSKSYMYIKMIIYHKQVFIVAN